MQGYFKVGNSALRHPKLARFFRPRDPLHLWLWGLAHSQEHLTDGLILHSTLPVHAKQTAVCLVNAGLWEEAPNGYQIHDYLEHADSRQATEKRRLKWAAKQQKHRHVTGGVPRGVPQGQPECHRTKQSKAIQVLDKEHLVLAFDRFWSVYPRHIGKAEALKAFTKLNPSDELLAQLLAAVEVQKYSAGWVKDSGQFIPHAATWLRARRWEDEVAEAPKPAGRLTYTSWECPHDPPCSRRWDCHTRDAMDEIRAETAAETRKQG